MVAFVPKHTEACMQYDPSLTALLHPEHRPPLGQDLPWSEAAIFAECSRLAYLRFEIGGVMKFPDKATMETYNAHPVHQALLKWLLPLIDPIEVDFPA